MDSLRIEISHAAIGKFGEIPPHDHHETNRLAEDMAGYIVAGWWDLCSGDLRKFEGIISAHKDRAIASICSMISLSHAIRSGQGDEWVADLSKH